MSSKSKIEWTDATWNPVTGCTPISPGCAKCYAQRYLHRFKRPKHVVCHPDRLDVPARWSARRIFVCSMADLFHERVPDDFIAEVYWAMCRTPRHTYQVLTKRPERLLRMSRKLTMGDHIWHGVSVEDEAAIHRIGLLAQTVMLRGVRFVSFEPLLERVYVRGNVLAAIDWVIVGGETGPGARPLVGEWVREIRDTCNAGLTPFFFKQWGGKTKGALLDRRTWKEMPASG